MKKENIDELFNYIETDNIEGVLKFVDNKELKETLLRELEQDDISEDNYKNAIYDNCALELDGDVFGYIIRIGDETYNEDYPIDINCLKQRHECPFLLEKVIDDIRIYNMWEINYQQQN